MPRPLVLKPARQPAPGRPAIIAAEGRLVLICPAWTKSGSAKIPKPGTQLLTFALGSTATAPSSQPKTSEIHEELKDEPEDSRKERAEECAYSYSEDR